MARNAKRNNQTDDFWAHEAEELPRADVGMVTTYAKRQKFFKAWVITSLVLLPIACWPSSPSCRSSSKSPTSHRL